MIITRIIGGLGNQMFQYAVARSLAYKMKTDFKMDISLFDDYPLHNYSLTVFNILENYVTKKDLRRFRVFNNRSISKLKPFLLRSLKYSFYPEKEQFSFDSEITKTIGHLYLTGYWQNPKYFEDIEEIIRKDFTIKTKPEGKNLEFLSKIQNCNSIAIHIRRGDYISDSETYKKHGDICSLAYYSKGIQMMKDKVEEPNFFVFSDEPEWAKKHLKIDCPCFFISHNNPSKGFEDLRLMRNCKHFIIANSSFSWWGAWLSNNPQKIVISPQKWLKDDSFLVKDLIPEDWIRIGSQ